MIKLLLLAAINGGELLRIAGSVMYFLFGSLAVIKFTGGIK